MVSRPIPLLGPTAIADLPWIPVFLTICFLIHPWLGLAATAGGQSSRVATLMGMSCDCGEWKWTWLAIQART
jgi:ABC-type protease/lipase transport system fused ATPase/permease subunit